MKSQAESEKTDSFILIVEDSPTQAEQLKFVLEDNKYKVKVAGNGLEALSLMQKESPALIISDILMPQMSGFELCKVVKANANTSNIPVILLTSLSSTDDLLEGLACGADNFLTKPYNKQYLLGHIDQILSSPAYDDSERVKVSFEIQYRGRVRHIAADQRQMFSLLFSTYEAAVQRNNELIQSQGELNSINEQLEDLVEERTQALSKEIEERKKAQEQLKQSLSLLEATLESTIDGILVVDNEGHFKRYNRKFVELWNIPESMLSEGNDDKILKFIFQQIKHPDRYEGKVIKANIEEMATSHNTIDLRDGRVLEQFSKPRLIDGKAVGRVWSFWEITKRMRALANLRESEKRLELAVRSADLGMWDLDLISDTAWRTLRHDQIFGYNTLLPKWGKSIFFKHVLPEDREAVEKSFAEAFLHDKLHFECRINAADGAVKWISAFGIVQRNEAGHPLRMLGSVLDITDRKQAEEEIKLKNEQLEKSNLEKDKFFSLIAHDLKSPFNVFLGGSELLVNELDELSKEQIRKLASSIHKSATTIYELLENLLEWSRLQRGKIQFDPETFQLLPEIIQIIDLAAQSATRKGIDVQYNIPPDFLIFADKHMFQTAARNLIFNAVKFTHKGGNILIKAGLIDEKFAEISVIDSGIGMSEEIIETLFDINKSTCRKGTAGEASTGLGLIISREFIEKNGGKLWVESKEGQGSTFSFSLPVGAPDNS